MPVGAALVALVASCSMPAAHTFAFSPSLAPAQAHRSACLAPPASAGLRRPSWALAAKKRAEGDKPPPPRESEFNDGRSFSPLPTPPAAPETARVHASWKKA
jgi:hypothetical protein